MLQIQKIIDKYGGFDGAVVKEIKYFYEDKVHCISMILKVYPNNQNYLNDKWREIKIKASGSIIFSWIETSKKSNLVINYPVKLFDKDGKIIIDFDPLQSNNEDGISNFFLGAKNLIIEE